MLWGSFALVLALWPGTAGAAHGRGPGPMPWRIGHEVGFTADAASFPDSSGNILEVYFRIRPSLIADLCRAGRDPAPVRVIAKLRSVFGGKTQEREQIFQVNPADTTGTLGEVVVLSFPTKPGSHHLELRLETRRRQLARMGMEKPEAAKVSGDIEIPGPQAGREISDLQFVLGDADRQLSHVFGRSGHDLLPNPERLYGLYATDLRALFTARGASEEPRPWHWVARILGTGGQVYALQESSEVAARTIASEIRLDVSTLPAGPYDLEVKAWQEGDAGAVLRRSRFTVGWQVGTWRRDPLDIADDAHFLLKNDDEEDRFEKLPAGEQEAILDTFWLQRDPTPETGENEARTMYLKRVDYANRMYGRYGIGRGMFSDMGRTFIRYGEPNEVYRQVMPALDDNLVNLVTQLARAETRQLGSNLEKPEVGGDMRPFELWLYEGDIPLPIDADPKLDSGHATRRRLVFLFVDQNWLGDYRLLYSSE